MTEPRRYRDDPRSPSGRLLAEAAPLRPWSPAAKALAYQQLRSRLGSSAVRPWLVALLPALAVAGLGLLVIVPSGLRQRRAREASLSLLPRAIDLGAVGQLQLSADAALQLPGAPSTPEHGYAVTLAAGRLCAKVNHRDLAREGPFLVRAGPTEDPVQVTVVGTRFCVEVLGGRTVVSVSEGRVRVERQGHVSAQVAAGESVASDGLASLAPASPLGLAGAPFTAPPAVAAPAPSLSPPAARSPQLRAPTRPVAGCASEPALAAQEGCYQRLVNGQGLSAEEALYSLAVLARDERGDGAAALRGFRSYLARFPAGVLAPEAAQGALAELEHESRHAEALAAADEYLSRFGDAAARSQDVAMVRARLLRDELGRPAEALTAYRQLLGGPLASGLRDEALFSVGLCEERLGHGAEARAAFERYRAELPQGRHAAEVEQRAAQKE